MPETRTASSPRTFFLNEHHELSRGEKASGGRLPKLAPLDWHARGRKISDSLLSARETVDSSTDPLRRSRYFLATVPAPTIRKESDDSRRATDGIVEEKTDYAGEHSRIFRRLGLDLLSVDESGLALVHAPAPQLEQLLATASGLGQEGRREQARWVAIQGFEVAPSSFRLDGRWLDTVPGKELVDAVVELQPLLTRLEVEQVVRAISEALQTEGRRERFTRTGIDFSGRHWFRGLLSRESLRAIADHFYSVQSLHPPLYTEVVAISGGRQATGRQRTSESVVAPIVDPSMLPVVAVVDVGVPAGHSRLAQYRRGRYVSPDVPADIVADHAARVASRVVFGDPDFSSGIVPVGGDCSFVDVNIAKDAAAIDDKALLVALQAVVATYPDVRVFNLSFGEYAPLQSHLPVERREKLILLQDLDNFIFRSDVVVVVAAGNSRPGIAPHLPYPGHIDDPAWALGSWACGFNSLKCGSYVGRISSAAGLVKNVGWPSPFTRIGPGLCGSNVPEFSANGGNCTEEFGFAPGLGVWACDASGRWEDYLGTSLAAPLLAREAAFAFAELQGRCEQGARPFGATVKAFLTLTAKPPESPVGRSIGSLIERTLGRGTGTSERLREPLHSSAVLVWQGVLEGPEDMARIQIPVPSAWLAEASRPLLRLVAAWEVPVNEAVEHTWACRRIEVRLRREPTSKALMPQGRVHGSYPLLDRRYRLRDDEDAGKGRRV